MTCTCCLNRRGLFRFGAGLLAAGAALKAEPVAAQPAGGEYLLRGGQVLTMDVALGNLNMAPVEDPYYALVFLGQPGNVDTVMVDGRVLVRQGRHMAVDVPQLVREAADSARAIVARAPRPG